MLKNKKLLFTLLFIASMLVHLIGLNQIGRTWDEQGKMDIGFIGIDRWINADFSVNSWLLEIGVPMIARYYYGFFYGLNIIKLDDGMRHLRSFSPDEISHLQNTNFITTGIGNHLYAADYDFIASRIASAFMNSLAVTLTAVLAYFFMETGWALIAGAFLIFMPRFLVMGQLATYESISAFLYCVTALVFYKLLSHYAKAKYYVFVGLLTGLLF